MISWVYNKRAVVYTCSRLVLAQDRLIVHQTLSGTHTVRQACFSRWSWNWIFLAIVFLSGSLTMSWCRIYGSCAHTLECNGMFLSSFHKIVVLKSFWKSRPTLWRDNLGVFKLVWVVGAQRLVQRHETWMVGHRMLSHHNTRCVGIYGRNPHFAGITTIVVSYGGIQVTILSLIDRGLSSLRRWNYWNLSCLRTLITSLSLCSIGTCHLFWMALFYVCRFLRASRLAVGMSSLIIVHDGLINKIVTVD